MNHLFKVSDDEFGLQVYRVLCESCKRSYSGFKKIKSTALPCERCGISGQERAVTVVKVYTLKGRDMAQPFCKVMCAECGPAFASSHALDIVSERVSEIYKCSLCDGM